MVVGAAAASERLYVMSQQPLDYQARIAQRKPWSEWRKAAIGMGVGVGVVSTLPALFLALISAGAGHGDYGFARGLFPVPMCIAVYVTGSIELPSLALAFLQFPLYGATIGYFATRSRKTLLIAGSSILLGHLVAFAACSGPSAFS